MLSEIEVHVECYAGYRADQWHGPDYRYFKSKGEGGGIYILRHDEMNERWELTMFDAGVRDETRLSST